MSIPAHLSDDRLIDLARGLLPPQAEPELLGHLESCPLCEDRFRRTCKEAEIGRLRRLRAPRQRSPWWIGAAAAAALIAAFVLLWDRSPAPSPSAYWFPLAIERVGLRTGESDPQAAAFEAAAEAYRRRDPERVVALLRGREIPEAHDPLKIVLASALVKTGEPAAARQILHRLRIETLPQPDRDRARWILYAALVAEGRNDQARALAADLASRPGEFSEAARPLSRQR